MISEKKIKIFIISKDRPIYLWNCLDSVYRLKSDNSEVILFDNGSNNETLEVIKGFDKRNLFKKLYLFDENNKDIFHKTILHENCDDEYFIFIESDVEILTKNFDLIMLKLIEENENYGFIGSRVYKEDFHEISDTNKNENQLLKKFSPEKNYNFNMKLKINNLQPPGRLVIIKKELFTNFNKPLNDSAFHNHVLQKNHKSGISTEVLHRHLSLLNYFDYPHYNMKKRNDYFNK